MAGCSADAWKDRAGVSQWCSCSPVCDVLFAVTLLLDFLVVIDSARRYRQDLESILPANPRMPAQH